MVPLVAQAACGRCDFPIAACEHERDEQAPEDEMNQ
jgi:hypothetical protein